MLLLLFAFLLELASASAIQLAAIVSNQPNGANRVLCEKITGRLIPLNCFSRDPQNAIIQFQSHEITFPILGISILKLNEQVAIKAFLVDEKTVSYPSHLLEFIELQKFIESAPSYAKSHLSNFLSSNAFTPYQYRWNNVANFTCFMRTISSIRESNILDSFSENDIVLLDIDNTILHVLEDSVFYYEKDFLIEFISALKQKGILVFALTSRFSHFSEETEGQLDGVEFSEGFDDSLLKDSPCHHHKGIIYSNRHVKGACIPALLKQFNPSKIVFFDDLKTNLLSVHQALKGSKVKELYLYFATIDRDLIQEKYQKFRDFIPRKDLMAIVHHASLYDETNAEIIEYFENSVGLLNGASSLFPNHFIHGPSYKNGSLSFPIKNNGIVQISKGIAEACHEIFAMQSESIVFFTRDPYIGLSVEQFFEKQGNSDRIQVVLLENKKPGLVA